MATKKEWFIRLGAFGLGFLTGRVTVPKEYLPRHGRESAAALVHGGYSKELSFRMIGVQPSSEDDDHDSPIHKLYLLIFTSGSIQLDETMKDMKCTIDQETEENIIRVLLAAFYRSIKYLIGDHECFSNSVAALGPQEKARWNALWDQWPELMEQISTAIAKMTPADFDEAIQDLLKGLRSKKDMHPAERQFLNTLSTDVLQNLHFSKLDKYSIETIWSLVMLSENYESIIDNIMASAERVVENSFGAASNDVSAIRDILIAIRPVLYRATTYGSDVGDISAIFQSNEFHDHRHVCQNCGWERVVPKISNFFVGRPSSIECPTCGQPLSWYMKETDIGPRQLALQLGMQFTPEPTGKIFIVDVDCSCGEKWVLQANVGKAIPITAGRLAFPDPNKTFDCPRCGHSWDMSRVRTVIESNAKEVVIA